MSIADNVSIIYFLAAVLLSAAITFALRALPFAIFRNGRPLPDYIRRLGAVLPSAIMAVLIVYCLKDVSGEFWKHGIWELVAVAVVVVTYKWKHNTFVSILSGTAAYMLFIRIF